MTLRNKLYANFGAVLLMVLVMFFVNWRAVSREHEAKQAAASSSFQRSTHTEPRLLCASA